MEGSLPAFDTAERDPALLLSQRRKMEILFAILLGLFLSALDQTIVGTALPTIVGDLHGTNELYTWVVTIYLLTATISGVFYGKLSDLYGRRPMLLIGVSLFLIGSALSGLSWSMESLILFRGIQGLGAGALFPISLAVIGDMFTPVERGRYQGLFGAVFGLSAIIGPFLGGWLTETFSWHWIFYVNIPIGLVALYIIYRYLPTVRGTGRTRDLDFLGAAVFTVAISLLLIGLTYKGVVDPQTGHLYQWTDPIVGGLILVSAIVGVFFLFVESRAREPIIPLDLWRNRSYSTSMVATFLASFGFFGAVIFLPRWFQFVKGVSPTESGLQVYPLLIGVIGSSVISGLLISRSGRYKAMIIGALAVMAVGLFLMTGLTADTADPVTWVWMFIAGVGIGPTLTSFTIVVQNAVPFDKLGVATSNLTFFRQIGGSIALAVVGTLFAETFANQIVPQLEAQGVPVGLAPQIGAQATSGSSDVTQVGVDLATQLHQLLPASMQQFIPGIVAGIHQAFSLAVASTFWVGVVAAVVALGVAVVLPELPLRGMAPAGRPAAAGPEPGTIGIPVTAGVAAASQERAASGSEGPAAREGGMPAVARPGTRPRSAPGAATPASGGMGRQVEVTVEDLVTD